jgi:hypothetical protein
MTELASWRREEKTTVTRKQKKVVNLFRERIQLIAGVVFLKYYLGMVAGTRHTPRPDEPGDMNEVRRVVEENTRLVGEHTRRKGEHA